MSRDIRSTYLGRQLEVLRRGVRDSPWPVEPIAEFLRHSQNADGGFSGRGDDSDSSQSDLYYTAFGLWGLAALDRLSAEVATRAVRFLAECWQRPTHLVDFFSLLHGYRLIRETAGGEELIQASLPEELRGDGFDWADLVSAGLETCRSLDGGYARTPGQKGGSTYATFLTVLCFEEIERPLPDAEAIRRFLQSRQRADGGFVELGPMKRSGTNPTAAAVAVRRILGDSVPSEDQAVREFLIGLQGPDGGLRANTVIPISDLLSTFTGLWTLTESGGFEGLDVEKVLRFVKMMEHPGGGFLAGLWDDAADVEYAFYGLGSSALLSLASAGNERSSGATA
jgi:geranylgeranyl transferase type-2 subunit beta